ncbi:MAG: ABC transporter, permease protein (cluster 3, basic aa/glutamine/opines) [uncultured Acidimicrobiales bacterium]|uniref:ABC transporter, permease protein (Cluster 3, basic aa/glutamine/opines) n=1 Tax=uncultured Acidimicrobiales bacterium TaxID=310071 RepID=A0A6J4I1F9_9ACTN|nr:MAG: ABC transporter, permease protein (cluster 3, basic aa/glutamine/opines) [uncultured Acidimicrobiales bacterium]
MSSVLYDVPGPRARLRNRLISVAATLVILALLWYVAQRFSDTGQFESVKWQQFRLPSIQRELFAGLRATLKAAGLAAVLALAFGVVFAAARLSDHRFLRWPASTVVELFRAIPLLILIFYWYYVPLQYGRPLPTLWALVLGLTLYNGSVLAEIFRAGILSVAKGQSEAAYAVGMRKSQVTLLILMPQAVRSMLPTIISQLVVLLKDTALGFIITYPELLSVGKLIGGRLTYGFPYVPTYLVVAAIYISICLMLSTVANGLERRTRRSHKTTATPTPPAEVAVQAGRLGQGAGPV